MKQFLKDLEERVNNMDEFWKAIALTNECMVSEVDGELKYSGTSPDDNELVKTANRQGYKLFNTSINKKMVLIGEEEVSFEILHVLGFSSERKRMSIIVEDSKGVIKMIVFVSLYIFWSCCFKPASYVYLRDIVMARLKNKSK